MNECTVNVVGMESHHRQRQKLRGGGDNTADQIKCAYARRLRSCAYALGLVDGTEGSADNDLFRRDAEGGQVRQVVFECPLILKQRESSNITEYRRH